MKNVNFKIIILLLLSFALANCTTTGKFKKPKSVHGDQPLINTQEVVEQGRKDMERIIEAGPKPYDTEIEIERINEKQLPLKRFEIMFQYQVNTEI